MLKLPLDNTDIIKKFLTRTKSPAELIDRAEGIVRCIFCRSTHPEVYEYISAVPTTRPLRYVHVPRERPSTGPSTGTMHKHGYRYQTFFYPSPSIPSTDPRSTNHTTPHHTITTRNPSPDPNLRPSPGSWGRPAAVSHRAYGSYCFFLTISPSAGGTCT